MNHIYRIVWNTAQRAFVVVAENAKGKSKSTSSRSRVGLSFILLLILSPSAFAAPSGGQVSTGSGVISQHGSTTTIDQTSANLAINWQDFSVGTGETVRFNQPNSSAIVLNRVTGQNPSEILGSLHANGQVFVLNPNGVLFGAGSQVNVGGLVASTLSLSDADLNAGKFTFVGNGTHGTVVNRSSLNAAQAGYIALLAPDVRNEGTIIATRGSVALAAGDQVSLNLNNGSLLSFNIDKGAFNALAENRHLIEADGGQVLMSASASNDLSSAVVNNSGVIQARTLQNVAGVIRLIGDLKVGSVHVSGVLDASATNGGNGGMIETSAAHFTVANDTFITTQARNGNNGMWLIDPVDFTISAAGGDMTGAALSTALGLGNVTILSTSGAGGINGNINVNDVVSWNTNKLTLNAQNNININANLNGSGTASLALEYGQAALAAGNLSNYLINGAQINLSSGNNFSTKLGSNGVPIVFNVINDLVALRAMSTGLTGNYALGSNVDAIATAVGGQGFTPVGDKTVGFSGSFAGLGHAISNLAIKMGGIGGGTGFFGVTSAGSVVRDIGLVNAIIASGASESGLLIGNSRSTVFRAYTTGSLFSINLYDGGLIGYATGGSVSQSWSSASVTTNSVMAGGLIGLILGINVDNSYSTGNVTAAGISGGFSAVSWGNITNCYSTGVVSNGGPGGSGAFIPASQNFGILTNNYFNASVNPITSAASAGTGLTSAQMQVAANFVGFDFANIWYNFGGAAAAPVLNSFITNLYVTANSATSTYTGLGYAVSSKIICKRTTLFANQQQ